jgi:S-DNA-T family DNA segregation ATPase FtsK/SpoIIIE
MAVQRRTRTAGPRRESVKPSAESRTAVLAVLMMAAGLLLLLALVSYSTEDAARAEIRPADLWDVIAGDPQVRARADTTQNWLGLVGAMVSHFMIQSTIGYAVFCVPLLLIGWGWVVMRRRDLARAITITNYVLLAALLASASLGMFRILVGREAVPMEWSGLVGDFLASVLSQLLGKTGGSILLLAIIAAILVYTARIDLDRLVTRAKVLWLATADAVGMLLAKIRERIRLRVQESRRRVHERPPRPVEILQRREEVPRVAERGVGEREETGSGPAVQTRIVEPKVAFASREEPLPPSPPRAVSAEHLAYVFPGIELLTTPPGSREEIDEGELKANADLLRATLAEFDVELESVSVTPGPVVTLYELVPASGVKISRIVSLENDIALKLAAKGIRIMAPIPGKSAVGVEIPNSHRSIVSIRSVINTQAFRSSPAHLSLALGKTIAGEVYTDDLTRMPHLLIAGSTGSGKSVGINTILASLFFRMHPRDLKLVIIDPKKIEMAQYARLRNHFLAVSPDIEEDIVTTPAGAVMALRGVELEMERRYNLLAKAGVRNLTDYNTRIDSGRIASSEEIVHVRMPYLVVVIDELADLMITAAREVEEPIARLAQLARAVGIHLVVATQRPSVDVITGVIKANFPARIAYQVASKTDSRTILDMNGAEQLLGNGDMLYLPGGSPKPIRLQNAYIAPDEVDAVVDHIAGQQGFAAPFLLPSLVERKRLAGTAGAEGRDDLFEEAARLIVRHQQGSVSLLQRRLKVGYSRAARLVDELEAAGVVGPFDGSKARAVLVESEEELDAILNA